MWLGEVVDPMLAGTFMVGQGKREPLAGRRWAVAYGSRALRNAVDLDGDGVDELVVHESGYEYHDVAVMGWNGSEYAPLPAGK